MQRSAAMIASNSAARPARRSIVQAKTAAESGHAIEVVRGVKSDQVKVGGHGG
jgi:hypothetical protein